ncbi:unnamed protein product [Pseudo-nitzschia multistriata]|uniref:Uncharacterized protein n=1 Tax=Pseudo-nitzschia multistriata TaxID=183589 RepID=A0A448YW27_9STRA|nr:unnamed protein product [Pseudo-nitzschia multistriata]
MESISLDNSSLVDRDCNETVHSLRSLVSSDDTECSLDLSSEPNNIIPSTAHRSSYDSPESSRLCCASSRRSICTEMSIIASSSPEIKALLLPTTSMPAADKTDDYSGNDSSSTYGFPISCERNIIDDCSGEISPSLPRDIHCQHQRSIGSLPHYSLEEDANHDIAEAESNKCIPTFLSTSASVDERRRGKFDGSNNWFIEHRDQHNGPSMNRFGPTEDRDVSTNNKENSILGDETDELTLYLERYCM